MILSVKLLPATVYVCEVEGTNASPIKFANDDVTAIVGDTFAFIVNVWPDEVPPPGVGLVIVTVAVPALAISAAVIEAVNVVALTNVVVFAEPFQLITELE